MEREKSLGSNIVSFESARARKNEELAKSPEALALAEGEESLIEKWGNDRRVREFFDELREQQGKFGDRAALYTLTAMGGIGAALFGLPEAAQNNLNVLMDSNFSTLAEITTRVLGAGAAVVATLESLQSFSDYFRKGREIQGHSEAGEGRAAIA